MKNMAHLDDNGNVVNISVHHDDAPETEMLIAYSDDNPAWIGGDYVDGFFYEPQPFASWTRSEGKWLPPVERPTDGLHVWNEDAQEWQAVNPT